VEELRQESDGTAQRIVDAVVAQIPAHHTSNSDSGRDADGVPQHPTYSAGAGWGYDARVRAREGVKLRQVLVDAGKPGEQILEELDSVGLAKQANEILRNMDAAPDHTVVSARRLSNGGVLFEFGSEDSAKWVNEAQRRIQFTSQLAPDARMKTRLFPIVLQFVPLHFGPDRGEELRAVEGYNKLPCGAVDRARWLKPVHRRAANQTCGHALVTFTSPEVANRVLTDGLIICQKRVYAEKCKKEPTRCLKCQGWNHLSYTCPQQYDTCGTCGDRHKTPACTQPGKLRCASCKVEGHASWDRACPAFVRRCEELDARMLENQMPYFPTEEPWTHVSQPPKPSLPPRWTVTATALQAVGSSEWQTVSHRKGKYKQTTIPFQRAQQEVAGVGFTPPAPPSRRASPATSPNSLDLGPITRWGDTTSEVGLPPAGRS
jgi:hypothetical protein